MTFMQIVWAAAALGFLALEVVTPGALVSIWLMAGAVVTLLLSFLCPVVWVQCTVFVLVSAALLLFTRPLVRRTLAGRFVPTNADAIIGKRVQVIQPITPPSTGRVQAEGVTWAARAKQPLGMGEWCTVEAIHGATLTVSPCAPEPTNT